MKDLKIENNYDLVIIGGGITGAGIIGEAARMGIRVLLVEKNDFAWGTSSKSSKLVHGGLRYLKEGRVHLTWESVREREKLMSQAPGLVDPIDFTMPIIAGRGPGRAAMTAGLTLYDLMAGQVAHTYHKKDIFSGMVPHMNTENLKGGFRFMDAQTDDARLVLRLINEAVDAGACALNYTAVTEIKRDAGGAVTGVVTKRGTIRADMVVVAVGPWVRTLWTLLELPAKIAIKTGDGTGPSEVPMWTYWSLQEGTLGIDPTRHRTNDGAMPPVLHVDSDAPLYSDVDGTLISDEPWGIYYKPDFHFGGVQGGAMPFPVARDPDDVAVDPYGPASPDFVVDDHFIHMWCSALAHCQKRFEGTIGAYRKEPSGGIGAFTPDSFPVFDRFRETVYVIADSNHGYKMIGVGELVAGEILGRESALLAPFRFSRFAEGQLHPVSNSPFPWS